MGEIDTELLHSIQIAVMEQGRQLKNLQDIVSMQQRSIKLIYDQLEKLS